MIKLHLDIIKFFCNSYDQDNGTWPENKYEGESVYKYILGCLYHSWDLDEQEYTKKMKEEWDHI